MCLFINLKKHFFLNHQTLEPIILDADLVVFKVIKENNDSLHYNYPYQENSKYKINIGIEKFTSVERGFHAYTLDNISYSSIAIFLGSSDKRNLKIVKMVIPSGSKIFYGIYNDIVSDNIHTESLESVSDSGIRLVEEEPDEISAYYDYYLEFKKCA